MAYRLIRGMGAAGDASTADVPAGPCGTRWSWSIPTCWQWPKALIYGDKYPAPPAPPVVRSTLPDGSPIPAVPGSQDEARATIDAITGQQIYDWQDQTDDFFKGVNEGLKSNGLSPWVLVLAGVGLFAAVAIGGGRPRRYGR